MTKGRDNVAESLGEVVEFIQSRQHTGLLSIERYEGGRFEEGEIYFLRGRPVYAHSGTRVGRSALAWLSSWYQVSFCFLTNVARPATNIFPPAASSDASVLPSTEPISQFRSSLQTDTGPQTQAQDLRSTNPDTPIPQPSAYFSQSAQYVPAASYPQQEASAYHNEVSTVNAEWLVPQKIGINTNVLSLPLTRPQRSLYLLVDGRRTISDLARCVRKSVPEVSRLLWELREHDLISL